MITTVFSPIRKIIISLPSELVAFADSQAQQNQQSQPIDQQSAITIQDRGRRTTRN